MTSRRVGGRPGDRIAGRPVIAVTQPSARPTPTPSVEVLRRPIESAQYTSLAFSQRLSDAGIAASMGSVGDAYDNSMIESFWGTIKSELLYRHVWPSRHDAEMAIFEWIESWYNRERLHSGLGYLSPEQFEQQHHNQTNPKALATAGAN